MKNIQFHNNIKNEFIQIKNSVEDNEININGPIGGDSIFDYGYSFDDFKRDLSKINGRIVINIKSYGGNLFEALAIYDYIRSLKNKVTTKIIGTSASAATVISLAGDERLISKNSRYLIHKPSIMAMGNSDDFKKVLEQLEDLDRQLVDLYAERCKMSKEAILELMTKEEFISSGEAIEKGFIDGYIEEKSKNKPKNNDNTSEIGEVLNRFLNEKNINIMELVENLKDKTTQEEVENTTEDTLETQNDESTVEEVTDSTEDVQDTEDNVEDTEDKKKDKEEEKENKKDDDEEEENKDDDDDDDKDKTIKELKEEIEKLKKKLAKNEVDEAEEMAMELTNYLDQAVESGKIKEDARDEWMNIGVEQGIEVVKTLMSSIPEKKVSAKKLSDVVTKSDTFVGKEDIVKQWKNGEIDTDTYLKLVRATKK